MIGRIRKYKRYKDYYAIKCPEVQAAAFVTFIFTIFLFNALNFYETFINCQDMLQQILLSLVGGEFTLLGMSLAGMAIITAMFSPELIKVINKVDKNDTINRILSQFEFSALNLGIHIIGLLLVYFAVASNKKLINFSFFVICFVILCYFFCFNLFYIIALIGNCIKINEIKDKCNMMAPIDRSTISVANELRIDYILAGLLRERKISKERLLEELFLMIEKGNIQDKQKVKDYLESYYRDINK